MLNNISSEAELIAHFKKTSIHYIEFKKAVTSVKMDKEERYLENLEKNADQKGNAAYEAALKNAKAAVPKTYLDALEKAQSFSEMMEVLDPISRENNCLNSSLMSVGRFFSNKANAAYLLVQLHNVVKAEAEKNGYSNTVHLGGNSAK